MAYEQVAGPLGPERGDLHAAIVAVTVANALRGKGKPLKIDDFLPQWATGTPAGRPAPARPVQSWQEQLAIVQALNAQLGGADHHDHDR